jgi:hypothetical protein
VARDRKIEITIKNDIVYEDKLDEYVRALVSYSLGQHCYKVSVRKVD